MLIQRIIVGLVVVSCAAPAFAWRGNTSGSASGAIALAMMFIFGAAGGFFKGPGGGFVGALIGLVLAVFFAKQIAFIFVCGFAFWLISSLYKGWKEK